MPLFPESTRPPAVKICGITQLEQARAIIDLGADALGINFWPGSKRYIPLDNAAAWLPEVYDQTTLVAVMVDPEPALLERLLSERVVHILQLHGNESPADVERLMNAGARVIKALQVKDRASLAKIGDYPCESLLLDAYNPAAYGGTGETFPWELAVEAQERHPEKKIILSGGLTPANVRQAVRQTHCLAVDVASGVENGTPGIKDLDQVRRFIAEAHAEHEATQL